MKSGYCLLYKLNVPTNNHENDQIKSVWAMIWSSSTPKKIQIFLWKVVKGILLMAANLANFNIPIGMNCMRCGYFEEIVVHALFNCSTAHEVWSRKRL